MTGDSRQSGHWLFTPIVAFGATLVGVVVLFYFQAWVLGDVIGAERACGDVECGLGIGVWLIVSGFAVLTIAFIAGVVLGVRRSRSTPDLRSAVRGGLVVAAWCVGVYALVGVVIWWPKG